jgi:uncharacterized protein (TIGR03086 family)
MQAVRRWLNAGEDDALGWLAHDESIFAPRSPIVARGQSLQDRQEHPPFVLSQLAEPPLFAAAARGLGPDLDVWRVESVVDAVRSDPARTYAEAAHDVLDAFAVDGTADALFALPEFGEGAVFPGEMAMGFHFVDYLVHGWDVASSLGVPYQLTAEIVRAVMPLALAVPDGDFRTAAGSPFGPALDPTADDDFERILRHLGRRPE